MRKLITLLLLIATITVNAQYKIVADYTTMTLSDLTSTSFIQTSTAYSYGTWGSDLRFVGFGTQTYTFASTEIDSINGVSSVGLTTANIIYLLDSIVAVVPTTPVVHYGRATVGGVVCYSIPGNVITATSTIASVINTIYYDVIWVENEITINQIAVNVTTGPVGTGKIHVGIYNADTAWQPTGAPLVDSVLTILNAATGIHSTGTFSLTLPRGRYLLARNANAVLTCRSWRGWPVNVGLDPSLGSGVIVCGGSVAYAYGSLPSSTPWTAIVSGSGDHMVVLRVSTP